MFILHLKILSVTRFYEDEKILHLCHRLNKNINWLYWSHRIRCKIYEWNIFSSMRFLSKSPALRSRDLVWWRVISNSTLSAIVNLILLQNVIVNVLLLQNVNSKYFNEMPCNSPQCDALFSVYHYRVFSVRVGRSKVYTIRFCYRYVLIFSYL